MLEIGNSETRMNLVDLLSNRLANGAEASNLKSSRREPLVKEGGTRFQDALRQQGHVRAQEVRSERSEGRYGAIVSETARQTRSIGNRQSVAAGNEEEISEQNGSVPENADREKRVKRGDQVTEKVEDESTVQEPEEIVSWTEQGEEASLQMVLAAELVEVATQIMDVVPEEVVNTPMPQMEQAIQHDSHAPIGKPVPAILETIIGFEAAQVLQTSTFPSDILEKLEAILGDAGITAEMLETIHPESVPVETEALIQWIKAEGEGLRTRLMEAGADMTPIAPDQETLSSNLLTTSAASDAGEELNDEDSKAAPRADLMETVPVGEQTASFQQVTGPAGEESEGTQLAVSRGAGASEAVAHQLDKPAQASSAGTHTTFASVREQFSAHLQRMQAEGKNEMQLQLKPDHLGRLHLRVVEEKGHVLAKFTAESEQVRAILESNMQLLKDALEKNGVTVTALEVSVQQREGRDGDAQDTTGRERFGYANGIRNGTSSLMSAQVVSERLRQWLDGPTTTVSFKA